MRILLSTAAVLASVVAASPLACAATVTVDLTAQRLQVESASGQRFVWPISSAREGYVTPTGTFAPQRFAQVYYSKKYDNAPMPNAIFFYYGYAIHGTNQIKNLGAPASHGCVRLSPANSAKLFAMMKAEGGTITVTGSPPGQPPVNAAVNGPGAAASSGLLSLFGN